MNDIKWIAYLIWTGFPFEQIPSRGGAYRWPPCTPEDVAEVMAQMDPLGDWQTAKDQWLGAIIADVGFEHLQEWRESLQDEGSIL